MDGTAPSAGHVSPRRVFPTAPDLAAFRWHVGTWSGFANCSLFNAGCVTSRRARGLEARSSTAAFFGRLLPGSRFMAARPTQSTNGEPCWAIPVPPTSRRPMHKQKPVRFVVVDADAAGGSGRPRRNETGLCPGPGSVAWGARPLRPCRLLAGAPCAPPLSTRPEFS
jgi:hypothetical protein